MNILLKTSREPGLINYYRQFSTLNYASILKGNNKNQICYDSSKNVFKASLKNSLLFSFEKKSDSNFLSLIKRQMYTFRLSNRIVRNTHATRPKKTNNNSVELTYEQSQFIEKLGITKSWNSWNTSNLQEGKRQAENSFEDYTIRKFLYGTFHGVLASEIIIKRRFNQIDISFLAKLPRGFYSQKVYFLVGYSEELLSCLFKCVVKIQPQTINNKRDLIFRNW